MQFIVIGSDNKIYGVTNTAEGAEAISLRAVNGWYEEGSPPSVAIFFGTRVQEIAEGKCPEGMDHDVYGATLMERIEALEIIEEEFEEAREN